VSLKTLKYPKLGLVIHFAYVNHILSHDIYILLLSIAAHCWRWLIILQHWSMVLVIYLQIWRHTSCIWCRREDCYLMKIYLRYVV